MVMAAAQIGIASIFGVLRLDGQFNADAWSTRITLLGWFTITSVIAGAYASSRASGSGTRMTASFAAGLGGALGASVALYAARAATLPKGDAQLMVGIAIGFAAIAGFILAFGLLSAASLGWNAAATAAVVWAFIAVGVATHADSVTLGRLDTPDLSKSIVHSLTLWGLPVAMAVLALVTAIIARTRGHHRGAVAFTGVAGPATIALAYVIAGPGASDTQKIPWTAAMIAVVAGLAASLLVALPPRRTRDSADGTAAALSTASSTTSTSTEPLPELPRRRPFADLDDRAAPVVRSR
jgi:hypothetical protein